MNIKRGIVSSKYETITREKKEILHSIQLKVVVGDERVFFAMKMG